MESEFINFSVWAQKLIRNARNQSKRLKNSHIGTEHLLLAILDLPDSTAFKVLIPDMVADATILQHKLLDMLKDAEKGDSLVGGRDYTPRVKKILALAQKQATREDVNSVGTEHILLGMIIERDGIAGRILVGEYGITEHFAKKKIQKIRNPRSSNEAGFSEEEFVETSIQILQLPTEGLDDEKMIGQINHLKQTTLATLINRKSPVKGDHQFLVALRSTVTEATNLETIKHSAVLVQEALNGTAETVVRSAFVTQVRGTQAEKNLGTLLQLVTGKPVATEVIDYLKLWKS